MSQKNAGNIGSERSARHNAFMYLVIESCKMMKKNVEDYLKVMLERLRKTKEGDYLTCFLPCIWLYRRESKKYKLLLAKTAENQR